MCVYCSTMHNSKGLEPTQMPINGRLKRKKGTYTSWNTMQAIKRNEIMSFAGTWMELEAIILSKLTQEQKTNHHILSLISGR